MNTPQDTSEPLAAAGLLGPIPQDVEVMSKGDMNYFHGHGRIEYNTPQWLFDALNAEFKFTLDAAASKANAKCKRFYSMVHIKFIVKNY